MNTSLIVQMMDLPEMGHGWVMPVRKPSMLLDRRREIPSRGIFKSTDQAGIMCAGLIARKAWGA